MSYRLGLDLGTNSLGWCVLDLDDGKPCSVTDLGARIYTDGRDPQNGASLAIDRRSARSARRRRDRFLRRRHVLMEKLVEFGLMPQDTAERQKLEGLDPYGLRKKGLDAALTLYELGRAIFHLNQRRGFKSNRKTDGSDKEAGIMKQGITKLHNEMTEARARTFGEFLCMIRDRGMDMGRRESLRARATGVGKEAAYNFYPDRATLEDEFDKLWDAQTQFYPAELNDDKKAELRRVMFFQRPLKAPPVGKCTLDPSQPRASWALPVAQRFRILQELANLTYRRAGQRAQSLNKTERDQLYTMLLSKGTLAFSSIRRALKLGDDTIFNLENEKRSNLKGDETGAKLSAKKCFGPAWRGFDLETQTEVVKKLIEEEDEEALLLWLQQSFDLDQETSENIAAARLPDGHCRLSEKVLNALVPIIERQGLGYADAAKEAGYHHSDFRPDDEDIHTYLPYYGKVLPTSVQNDSGKRHDPTEKQFGKIANPTVHIALNQLRRIVNKLSREYGPPAEIIIEVTRELKQSQKEKKDIQKQQADFQKLNEQRVEKLKEIGIGVTREELLRMRLWEELEPIGRCCVYTGKPISLEKLFSPEIEIEHILPFSKTLDNSAANKTVSYRDSNREKGDRSPYAAWGHDADRWAAIVARAASLPKNKEWRFTPDAMDRFDNEERDFLDRQLTDTAYLARIAKKYLGHICPDNKIHCVPGRLTAMLRHHWGLNSILGTTNAKERTDHRHHAIDACVIGLTDRSMLQRVARASEDPQQRERLISEMPEPWANFRDELRDKVTQIIVSHKQDHGTQGKLHEETAYGTVHDPEAENGFNLVYRKPFLGLKENECARIRDPLIREKVLTAIAKGKEAGEKLEETLANFAEQHNIRRVRLLKKEKPNYLVAVTNAQGEVYKSYSAGDNHHIDIFEGPDGKWQGEAVTVFQANQKEYQPEWKRKYPDARLIMKVHKRDILMLEDNGEERPFLVYKLDVSAGRVTVAPANETGNLGKRHTDPNDPFRWLFLSFGKMKDRRTRLVHVNEIGRIYDPGPEA